MPDPTDITRIVTDLTGGDQQAAAELLPLVYQELRQLAQSCLRDERPDHTLVATALVHEAYLKLVDQSRVDWQGATHFKAIAAQAMMRVLVDHARGRNRQKRGGNWRRVTLDNAYGMAGSSEVDALDLDAALRKLAEMDERLSSVVQLRVIGGLTNAETAAALDVSERTIERDWKIGRAWLRRELDEGR